MKKLSLTVLRSSAFGMAAQVTIKVLSFVFSVFIVRRLGVEVFGQYAAVFATKKLRDLITAQPSEKVSAVIEKMKRHDISQMPVLSSEGSLALARDGELLPTGLTRHLIQGRALRTNYPLSELSSSDTLEAKNARLQEWLKQKMASKEIRFYGEATYLFDE